MKKFIWLLIILMQVLTYVNFAERQVNKNSRSAASSQHRAIFNFYSANKKYVIKCINQHTYLESGSIGQMYVCNTVNDSVLYKINLYLKDNCCFDQHFLSDDGRYFSFITYNCSSEIDKCNKLLVFENGELKQEIALGNLLEIKRLYEEGEYIFYNNTEIRKEKAKQNKSDLCYGLVNKDSYQRRDFIYKENIDSLDLFADRFPTFQLNDTIFMFNERRELFYIDVRTDFTGKINYEKNYNYFLCSVKPVYTHVVMHTIDADDYNFPDKEIIADKISKYLHLQYDSIADYSFHYYEVPVEGLLYQDSSFELTHTVFYEKLTDTNIIKIIKEHKFSTNLIPYFTERWFFDYKFHFRNPNDSLALIEMREHKIKEKVILKENAFKDSIDGVYIPKDLYEAMDILNANESEALKEKFRTFADTNYFANFDDRPRVNTYWELHKNSRIAHYLDSFGISHYEDQGAFINNVFMNYMKDDSIVLVDFNYKDFVLDSNVFIYFEYCGFKEKYIRNDYIKKFKKNINGKLLLSNPFEKTGDYAYNEWEIEKYDYFCIDTTSNLDSSGIIQYLANSLSQLSEYNKMEIPWDSLLLIECNPQTDHLLNSFRRFLIKDKLNTFMEVKKYKIYRCVCKYELDSLDNMYVNFLKSYKDTAEYWEPDEFRSFYYNILYDYLDKKQNSDFYVIRFYPYIIFNFKEYKKNRKRK